MGKLIFVTGGAGYVGAHICKALDQAGYRPVTYDDLSAGRKDFVKWGPLVVGDVRDTDNVERALARFRPAAVIHCAGRVSVTESVERALDYFAHNVGGTLSLLEAMKRQKINQLVFSSTCAIFGDQGKVAVAEECALAPANPYAVSKMIVEQMLEVLARQGDLRFVSLRYFNAAGADGDAEIGAKSATDTHLIQRALAAGMSGPALTIFGTDYGTADGTAVRDYVHVADLAAANLAALAYLAAGGRRDYFNLGTGRGHSVKEVVDTIVRLGVAVPFLVAPARAGDVACLVADPAKARTVLGWQLQYKTLDAIIKTAIAWHKNSLLPILDPVGNRPIDVTV
jgi:UDP-arabinose 4-epimerase